MCKERVTIDLPIEWYSGWLVVPAELVDIAPHLANVATFAITKDPTEKNMFWVINIETGKHIAGIFRTKKLALAEAQKTLSKISDEDMRRAYAKWKKERRDA